MGTGRAFLQPLASSLQSPHNLFVGLISPTDQQKLRDAFSEMTRSVRLLFFTQALGAACRKPW